MKLDDVLSMNQTIFAHRKEGQYPETLQEHTDLCCKYFERLIDSKKLMPCFREMWNKYFGESIIALEPFLSEMLEAMVVLHDAGKINPVYQRVTMKNPYGDVPDFSCLNDNNHSLLSAVIYMDYFYSKLKKENFSREEKKKIKGLLSAHAYVISRHHGDMGKIDDFLSEFNGGKVECIIEWFRNKKQPLYKGPFFFDLDNCGLASRAWSEATKGSTRNTGIILYFYMRLSYSLLVASDYYATTEYMSEMEIKDFGNVSDQKKLNETFEKNDITVSIRKYEKENYDKDQNPSQEKHINDMRSELFLDIERAFKEHANDNLYFLEAPTGSGKSHTSMNLSFKAMQNDWNKIFYIYPFNTLVEQNMDSLKKIFGSEERILSMIAVVNSVTPIKTKEENYSELLYEADTDMTEKYYQKALLDRQFLNYPFILTTHVSLFRMLFGYQKESLFGFLQLSHSVLILDEIQSYKNRLWSEIICFLKQLAKIMNCKIIIMSATLPDLEYLTDENGEVVKLTKNREKYFSHTVFRDRVVISYELLRENQKEKMDFETLKNHIKNHMEANKKILVEFIKKDNTYEFYGILCQDSEITAEVQLITGDDNQLDREKILNEIKHVNEKTVILVATQVIEAGVDIDMDIGYKDISKLDSEEQFMGRVNRSCKKTGIVYFFDMCQAESIYRGDLRINHEFTLANQDMKEILSNKKFEGYYKPVLDALKIQINESMDEEGLEEFFKNRVEKADFKAIDKRMKLIEEDDWHRSVYLSRRIMLSDGTTLDGAVIWNEYKELLMNQTMNYAEKQIELSRVRSNMANFIYQLKKNSNLAYSDYVGELYMIEKGDIFFENGKLNKAKLEEAGGLFIEF